MLKKFSYFIGLLLLILIGFVIYVMTTTGFFRDIENQFDGEIIKKVAVPGAEDFAISYEDNFLIISSDPRRVDDKGALRPGALYVMDLQDKTHTPKIISQDFGKPLHPHGIFMMRLDSAEYKLWVINHVPKIDGEALNHLATEHYIEVFRFDGSRLTHIESLSHPLIKSPNDVVAIDENRFYFSNDHYSDTSLGRFREEYLGARTTNVVYFDGKDYKIVADGIAYANGINIDKKKNLLYLASPRDFLLKVYDIENNGSLLWVEDIDCNTGVDNIEFDEDGLIWIGCHPNLLHFAEYAQGRQEKAPSELITIDYRAKGDYDINTVYLNDGSDMSASTVASVYENTIYVGNVMDEHFLVLQKN